MSLNFEMSFFVHFFGRIEETKIHLKLLTLVSLGDLLVHNMHMLWLPMHYFFYFMELNYDKLEDFCHCVPSFVASPHLFLTETR